jgi:DNA (cytosine-5)-methyltransferase 1
MNHLDLFSGIGGFALATEMAFPEQDIEHVFCDNDPFAQAVLKKHWPNSLIYGDIKEITKDRIAADTRREYGKSWSSEVAQQNAPEWTSTTGKTERHTGIDLLTGGFPCQPFSAAGRRKGTEDDRHLWPEMLRIIRETHPTFVLGENVGGLVTWDGGLVLEMVLTDLESAGYEAQPFIIPACALNAPHRRDRVWIAAHAIGSNAGGGTSIIPGKEGKERLQERDEVGESGESGTIRNVSDTQHFGLNGTQNGESSTAGSDSDTTRTNEDEQFTRPAMARYVATYSKRTGEGRSGQLEAEGQRGGRSRARSYEGGDWSTDWPQVAAELCTMDDGLPDGLARPKGWRNAALKGAGNAIVPQVAAEVIRAMFSETSNLTHTL